jgi:hypothetical protein
MKKETEKTIKNILAFIFVAVMLGGAWYIFLQLVTPPPVENTSVLVMVWGSLILLILAAFPKILERVKKIKAGDFELELQESIMKSSSENTISAQDLETQSYFHVKGRLEDLNDAVEAAIQNPKRTMVLVVNVFQGEASPAVLATYLYFLDLLSKPVVVIFVSIPFDNIKKGELINAKYIIGALSSEQVLNKLLLRYPDVFHALASVSIKYLKDKSQNTTLNLLRGIKAVINSDLGQLRYTYSMGTEEVENLFTDTLSRKSISKQLGTDDLKTLTKAIKSDDDFIFIIDGGIVFSVVPLCEYTRHFTGRILEQ